MQGRSESQRDLLDVESVAGHLLKPGSVFAFLTAHRHRLFPDELFADLFPSGRGRPSIPAEVMATVITLQALHGLSDSETVEAVTFDLRWKAACGLPVTAGGFHPTTLTYWRRRLAASARPERIFEIIRQVVAGTGVLAGKTRRALDSTVLHDAVATQDTVTQLIGAIRRVRREVPGATEVITTHCRAHDYDDPGKPAIDWNDEAARTGLVDALVGDAHRLLGHLPERELGSRAAEAVALLALIAGQDVEPAEGSDGTDGCWRIARKVAPDRVVSTVDPDARHTRKTVHDRQDGYKAHVVIEPDTGLFTGGRLTQASGQDNHEAVIGVELLEQEATVPAAGPQETAGLEVLGDSAYGSGQARAELAAAGHAVIVKPVPPRPAVPGGFTLDDFTPDEQAGTVTCPNGIVRPITASRSVTFGAACRGCPLRQRCTTSATGRGLTLGPYDALLRQARRDWREREELRQTYRRHRPMVERSIAWLVGPAGRCRKLRYRGVAANQAWLMLRLAGLNLRRLVNLGLASREGVWVLA